MAGLAEHDLPYAFDPCLTTRAVGLGAGPLLVNRIIQEHQGSVTLESQLMKGSRVSIELPPSDGD